MPNRPVHASITHQVRAQLLSRQRRMFATTAACIVLMGGVHVAAASGACGTMLGPLKVFCDAQPAVASDVMANWEAIKSYREARLGPMTEAQLKDGGQFKGDGAGLTNLLGTHVQSGTVPNTALSPDLATELMPTGAIVPWTNEVAPAGWKSCDGTLYSVTDPELAALYKVIGKAFGSEGNSFRVPDLRGRFLRGWNRGAKLYVASIYLGPMDPDTQSRTSLYAGGASGNQIGSYQGDEFGSHSHQYYRDKTTSGNDGSSPSYERYGPYLTDTEKDNLPNDESRPRNMYMHYIIKL